MPSRAQREKDARHLAALMEAGAGHTVFVFPDGGLQSNLHAGMDDERWPGPGEVEIRVPDARGRSRDELLEAARVTLADARAKGQLLLRQQLKEARKRADYRRARQLAPYVYRSGGRILDAIDREESAAAAPDAAARRAR